MPTYVYRCLQCEQRFELQQSFSDAPASACVVCGQGPVKKVFTPVGVTFKGSGFYKTDSRSGAGRNGSRSGEGGDGGSGSSASAPSGEASSSTSTAPSASGAGGGTGATKGGSGGSSSAGAGSD